MKKLFYLLFVLQSLYGISQNTGCDIPQILLDTYEYDVSQLAFERIIDINSPYKDSIIIPSVYKDTIWEGLAAVYNASTIPERDSVFDVYCIHNENCYGGPVQAVSINVDPQASWINNWENLEILTGIPELDSILIKYDFDIIDFSDNQAYIETSTFINLQVFIDSLTSFSGIITALDAESQCCHNVITYDKVAGLRNFRFELNFAPGIILCANHYIWIFEVDEQCSASLFESHYLISNPSELPSISNCNITSVPNKKLLSKNLSIYPNPATDYAVIESESSDREIAQIYNMQGQLVEQFEIHNSKIQIQISDWSKGIYLVKVGARSQKLIVE